MESEVIPKNKSGFRKVLAKYYKGWYSDCLKSVEFCYKFGDYAGAERYAESAKEYKKIIEDNEEAIEFFSVGDNAFLYDGALPEKFRGYE